MSDALVPHPSSLERVQALIEAAQGLAPVRHALDEEHMELRAIELGSIEALLPEVAVHFDNLPLPKRTCEELQLTTKKNWLGRPKQALEYISKDYVGVVLHPRGEAGIVMDRSGQLFGLFPHPGYDARHHQVLPGWSLPIVAPDPKLYSFGYTLNQVRRPFDPTDLDRLGIDTHQILEALQSALARTVKVLSARQAEYQQRRQALTTSPSPARLR